MPFKAINGYTDGDAIVFVCRDEHGKCIKRIENFDWYFYAGWHLYDILKTDPAFSKSFQSNNGIRKIVTERPYVKIHMPFTKIRDRHDDTLSYLKGMEVKTYEADVDPLKRFMIDSDEVEVSDTYRILYLDIETDDRPKAGSATNEIIIGDRQILSIAGFCTPDDNFVVHSFDEVDVLRRALKKIKDYDVLIGWNSDAFDIPYIKARIEYIRRTRGIDLELEFGFDWHHFIVVDLMWRFKHVYQHDSTLTSFSLKRVSERFEVGAKVDLSHRSIWDVFEKDPELGMKYNLQDCKLLYDLEGKLGIFQQMVAQARFSRTFLSQFYITELLDNLILREGKQKRIHLPTKEWYNKSDESYAGGYVLDPKPGFYKNINIFDFQSLYPNLIRSFNISPERMCKDGAGSEYIRSAKDGVFFSKRQLDPEDPDSRLGLLPRVVKGLLERRQNIKTEKTKLVEAGLKDSLEFQNLDRDEKIVKELANSAYGICGTPRSRYYSIDLAESITLAGQHVIKYTRDFFESLGFVVCAGDTDSIMVALPEGSEPSAILDRFHVQLRQYLIDTFNVDECFLKMKHEKRFFRFINVAKKNYVGRVSHEGGKDVDYIYAKGLELIKKDTIEFTRTLLKQLLQWLLYEDHDIGHFTEWMEGLRRDFHTREFSATDICFTKRVSKDFAQYKTRPAHVKLAEKLWASGSKEFFIGMDLRYFIKDNTDKENKAELFENYKGEFDRVHYWEHSVFPPLERILSTVFPTHDWSQYEKSAIKRPRKPRKPRKKKDESEGTKSETPALVHEGVSSNSR